MRSSVPDHCRAYALSDPGDQDYLLDCDHLAAKKTTDEDTEDDDEDEDHTAHLQRENHLQEMRDNIVTSMSIQNAHPIVYDSFNICELVQKSKLASFSIKLLQDARFSPTLAERFETIRGKVCRGSGTITIARPLADLCCRPHLFSASC